MCKSDMQGIETGTSDEAVETSNTGDVDKKVVDMVLKSTSVQGNSSV